MARTRPILTDVGPGSLSKGMSAPGQGSSRDSVSKKFRTKGTGDKRVCYLTLSQLLFGTNYVVMITQYWSYIIFTTMNW